jgi:hypothetical protein
VDGPDAAAGIGTQFLRVSQLFSKAADEGTNLVGTHDGAVLFGVDRVDVHGDWDFHGEAGGHPGQPPGLLCLLRLKYVKSHGLTEELLGLEPPVDFPLLLLLDGF